MANIWSRNKIWGGTFNTDVDVADDSNNASQVPVSSFFSFKFSSIVDATLTRSKYLTTVIAQSLRATLHKEEDRATGANIGVSGTGIEPTVTPIKFVVPEQLPEVDKTTNDFLTPAKSDANGVLSVDNDLFVVTPVVTDRKNKRFVVSFSSAGVSFFKARTWLQSEIEDLITTEINAVIVDNSLTGVRIGTISNTAHTTDDDVTRNIIINTRTIGKGTSLATLADDKYLNLYTHLWEKYPDAICTVTGTRGASANSDWLAEKPMSLPKIYGKVIVGKDGTTEFATIGQEGGERTHLLTGQESGVQTHAHTIGGTSGNLIQESGAFQVINDEGGLSVQPVSVTINNSGNINAVIAHNNLQPYVVLNAQITY